jgi:outer membrane protein OmpA-like peptidoglycan-associated protein
MKRTFYALIFMLIGGCSTLSEQQELALIEQNQPVEIEPVAQPEPTKITVPEDNLLFDFDSYRISSEQYQRLQRWADYINQANVSQITLHGHADDTGSSEYNYILSQKRAQAVKLQLQKLITRPVAIDLKAHGEDQPLNGNQTEAQRRENRRVEIEILSQGLNGQSPGITSR